MKHEQSKRKYVTNEMSAYDDYRYATKRMEEVYKSIMFHRDQLAKLEEEYARLDSFATESSKAVEAANITYPPFA